jgi:hypothetical protein
LVLAVVVMGLEGAAYVYNQGQVRKAFVGDDTLLDLAPCVL